MQTFIIVVVAVFALGALINELLSAFNISKPYPEIFGTLFFTISTVLGILVISKLMFVLLALAFVHQENKLHWDKYASYRTFDYTVCILGFGYQLYSIYQYIYSL